MFKALGVSALVALSALGVSACNSNSDRDNGERSAERTGAEVGRVVDDSVITGKVKAALVADPTTKAHQIDVDTYQGTVQLSGFVDNAEARARAAEIARDVDGVKDVKNSLALRTAAR